MDARNHPSLYAYDCGSLVSRRRPRFFIQLGGNIEMDEADFK